MVNYSGMSLALILFMLFSSNMTFAQAEEGPRIEFDNRTHDYGTVIEGEKIRHTFRVFNKGDRILQIKRVSPD